jgi:glutaredoxin
MKAEVYSKTTCPWCVKAKALLTNNGIEYTETLVNGPGVKEEIERKAGREIRTVPQIFIDGSYIGGYTDLEKYLNQKS